MSDQKKQTKFERNNELYAALHSASLKFEAAYMAIGDGSSQDPTIGDFLRATLALRAAERAFDLVYDNDKPKNW